MSSFNTRALVLKTLKYLILLGLVLLACIFTDDVVRKFVSNKTSIVFSEEERKELPTTVICFNPFVKMSVLDKYNISFYDFKYLQNIKDLPKAWDAWDKILSETFYEIDKDFNIFFKVLYDKHKLKLGQNIIKDMDGIEVDVEALTTIWNGICYKITATFRKKEMIDYIRLDIKFDNQLMDRDIPKVEIYLTSKANSYGILATNWLQGQVTKFSIDHEVEGFAIYDTRKKYLESLMCNPDDNHNFKDVIGRRLSREEIKCPNPCWIISYDGINTSKWPSFCKKIEDYKCMNIEFERILFYNSADEDIGNGSKSCNILEFHGHKLYNTPNTQTEKSSYRYRSLHWLYNFQSQNVQVQEEYFVYDFTGFVGSVGGTFGLFIGFSFWSFLNTVIELCLKMWQRFVSK